MTATDHPRFALTPGIAGGLGPFAHLWLERRLLERAAARFGAASDGDFPAWLVCSMPHTPDRTAALARQADDPTPFLLRSLERLKAGGADFAAVACNTAHAFLPRLAEAGSLPLPVVHVVVETADAVRRAFPAVRQVGLLATTGTVRAGLFTRALADRGIELVAPDERAQECDVMTAIYGPMLAGRRAGGIKAGQADTPDPHGLSPRQRLQQSADRLVTQQRAELILVACSEISLVADGLTRAAPMVDSMDVLADAVLDLAVGQRRLADLADSSAWPRPCSEMAPR